MNRYLEKIAKTRFKIEGLGNRFLDKIKSLKLDAVPHIAEDGIYSKGYVKNVHALINSRAANPEFARPYANYVAIKPSSPDHLVAHRINHFRQLETAGW